MPDLTTMPRMHFLGVARHLMLVATITLLPTVGVADSKKDAAAEALVGTYYLEGVTEVGSALRLKASGRFDFAISYGAVDQTASGSWRLHGGHVTLVSDTPVPAQLRLGERDAELLPYYRQESARPVLLSVAVGSPSTGLVWSNMHIAAQFSNGLTRSGVTGRSGKIAFEIRSDGEWAGATIKRVSAAYPKGDVAPVWVDVDSNDKTIVFHFEPGSLAPPAFETLTLARELGGNDTVVLAHVSERGGRSRGRYVRR